MVRPVVGDKYRVRPDGFDDQRPDDYRSTPAFHLDEIPIRDANRRRELRVHFTAGFWCLRDQSANSSGLCSRQIVRDDASGGQDDWIVGVGLLGGGPPVHRLEVRLPVGMAEPVSFVQPRGAGMMFSRTGPEDPVLAIDSLPRDSVIIGDAASRGDSQLVEDLARRRESKLVPYSHLRCQ